MDCWKSCCGDPFEAAMADTWLVVAAEAIEPAVVYGGAPVVVCGVDGAIGAIGGVSAEE